MNAVVVVRRDDVPRIGAAVADPVERRAARDVHAGLLVAEPNSHRLVLVGSDVIPLQTVVGRAGATGNEHAVPHVPGNHVALAGRRTSNPGTSDAVDVDAVTAVCERHTSGRIDADVVVVDERTHRRARQVNPVAAVAGDDVAIGSARRADDVACTAVDSHPEQVGACGRPGGIDSEPVSNDGVAVGVEGDAGSAEVLNRQATDRRRTAGHVKAVFEGPRRSPIKDDRIAIGVRRPIDRHCV